jgi:glyoxylate/hydroxypyruvate reductase A
MAILIHAGEAVARDWIEAFRAADPALETRVHPQLGNPDTVECLLSWKPPPGLLPKLTSLKLLQCSGAGVDQLLAHPEIPSSLPISRIVDAQQAKDLAVFALAVTLNWFRRLDDYRELQSQSKWQRLFPHRTVSEMVVGVMGLGFMGKTIARCFAGCGFPVRGWSRHGGEIENINVFSGLEQLPLFLSGTRVLICALPLTPETKGILSSDIFAQLGRPSFLLNLGRGGHLVEQALLAALERTEIDAAALDVHDTEPLPSTHLFWTHPRIRVTPHIAAFATPARVAPQIIENVRRVRCGQHPLNLVDMARGY